MVSRYLVPVALLIATSGCSNVIPAPAIDSLPSYVSMSQTPNVVIFRPSAFSAKTATFFVGIDEVTLVSLNVDEYTDLNINPGSYSFSVECTGDLARTNMFEIEILEGQVNFIELSPKWPCGKLVPQEGTRSIADFKKVAFGTHTRCGTKVQGACYRVLGR